MRLSHQISCCVIFAALGLSAGCGGSPEKPGDECNIDEQNCPDALVCAAYEDKNVCQIVAGGECDPEAEIAYCEGAGVCEDKGDGTFICIKHIAEGGACDPKNEYEICDDGLTCAEMAAGGNKCFPPVLLKGNVFDSETTGGIEGAHVLALNEVATAVSDIAVSDVMGNYSLEIPVPRDETGAPIQDRFFTLRSGAQGYQTFPGGLRTALPISSGGATAVNKTYVIETALTDIALIALPENEQGLPSISGTVKAGDAAGGVLVIAEAGGKGISAISDKGGKYTIFNVPDGSYTVSGYAAGVQLTPNTASVSGADLLGVDLALATEALGSIAGKLEIVNPGDGKATSVVLVVESTFNETFVRGEVPRGLRTPLSGEPNVTGDFVIENVPAGKYVVLAAFENDNLVRDPDTNIAGTQIVHVEMASPGSDMTLADSFKITGALEVFGPGVEQPEGVTQKPTLSWADDSSEDYYKVVVYDAYGNVAWEKNDVGSVSGGGMVSVPYEGPLEKGMYYQFRATSWRSKPSGDSAISATEDLRGVFFGQ
ncbi:MAG: carboxypeptidase regulatory-like domain-containing protein [Polyangiaceae bacterium]|nr:carboxypeptidase regulatory-like domain-containing protein [Polyangiaceae bacterium]